MAKSEEIRKVISTIPAFLEMKTLMIFCFPLLLWACKFQNEIPDALIVSEKEFLEIDYGTSIQLNGNPEQVSWTSSDESIASINEKGLLTANRSGEAIISRSSPFTNVVNVSVRPTNYLYFEPLTNFSYSKEAIKRAETKTLLLEGKDELIYEQADDQIGLVIYSFKNDSYSTSTMIFHNLGQAKESVVDFLRQRYVSAPEYGPSAFKGTGWVAIYQDLGKLGARVVYKES
jgi:hypothetical protein